MRAAMLASLVAHRYTHETVLVSSGFPRPSSQTTPKPRIDRRRAVMRLMLFRTTQVDMIIVQGSDVLLARLDAFVQSAVKLNGQVHHHLVSVTPTSHIIMPSDEPRIRRLVLSA